MCRFKLPTCPYPDQDPVSSLIFNPKKGSQWEHCDEPQPWGRLSCGKLVVEHPKYFTKSKTALSPESTPTACSSNSEHCEKHKHLVFPARQQSISNDPIALVATCEARPQGEPCKWCTAVLRLVATKSKEMQKVAQKEIAEVEQRMSEDAELRKMHEDIVDKEQELNAMRHDAWRKATVLMDDFNEDEREETQG